MKLDSRSILMASVGLLACQSSGTVAPVDAAAPVDATSGDAVVESASPDAPTGADALADALTDADAGSPVTDAATDATVLEAGPCDTCPAGAACVQGVCLGCTGPTVLTAGSTGDPNVGGFPSSLAVSGDTILVGAATADQGAGAVYVFTRTGGTWSYAATLAPPAGTTGFGSSVAISGSVAMVSASGSIVQAYAQNGTTWQATQALPLPDGGSPAPFIAMDGNTAAIAWPTDPASTTLSAVEIDTHVYVETGGTWSLQGTLSPNPNEWNSPPLFLPTPGVAIRGDLVTRTYAEGLISSAFHIWVDTFTRTGTTWAEQQSVDFGDFQLGAITARRDDLTCSTPTSSCDAFLRTGGWTKSKVRSGSTLTKLVTSARPST